MKIRIPFQCSTEAVLKLYFSLYQETLRDICQKQETYLSINTPSQTITMSQSDGGADSNEKVRLGESIARKRDGVSEGHSRLLSR